MVTLGFTSVICFSLSVACVALPAYGQYLVLQNMWLSMGTAGKSEIQTTLNCCGFDASNESIASGNPPCYSSDTGPVGQFTVKDYVRANESIIAKVRVSSRN